MKTNEIFLNSYLICALWSSVDDKGTPLDDLYDIIDISQNSVEKIKKECLKFLSMCKNLLENVDDISQVGHDFALTRSHHGSGFWDRPEIYGKENSQKLTDIAHSFGESYLYVGDDGKLYFE